MKVDSGQTEERGQGEMLHKETKETRAPQPWSPEVSMSVRTEAICRRDSEEPPVRMRLRKTWRDPRFTADCAKRKIFDCKGGQEKVFKNADKEEMILIWVNFFFFT